MDLIDFLQRLIFVIALQDLDLEGDWDPNAHDQQMAGLYGDDSNGDDEKPQWDDDIDVADIVSEEESTSKKKKKKRKKTKEVDETDEGVDIDAMDADVERVDDDEEWDGTEEMRKRKLNEYMDEIYGLDFNDMVSRRTRNLVSNETADMDSGRRHANSFQIHPRPITIFRLDTCRDTHGNRR